MFRQTSNRNQRAKGFKVKHVIQVCVLVAVCIWLLYQVKHSHDKKKALEERNMKISTTVLESNTDILRFGRKDLPHVGVEKVGENETQEEEGNEETDAEEAEPETKKEENEEEEGRGAGDDEIDENDQERADEEAEREESGDDEENEGKLEDAGLLENNDHGNDHDNGDANTQEAREVQYKGDDASSAVVRENEATESETENLGTTNMDEEQTENLERKPDLETDDKNNGTVITREGDETAVVQEGVIPLVNNTSLNENNPSEQIDHKDAESGSTAVVEANDQIQQQSNSTTEAVPADQMEQQSYPTSESVPDFTVEMLDNSTAVVDAEVNGWAQQNETVRMESDPNQNSTAEVERADTEKDENSNSEQATIEENENSNNTNKTESENSVNQTKDSGISADKMEESENGANKTEESDESKTTLSSTNAGDDAVPDEPNDSSDKVDTITEEEKDARTDLSTLPETQSDATSIEEIAAE